MAKKIKKPMTREELLAVIDGAATAGLPELALRQKAIRELPEEIGRLTSLETLDLYDNSIASLPESIGQLRALRELNLASNRLESLPESIGSLTSLERLVVYWNPLKKLPDSLGRLANLREIVLFNISPGGRLEGLPASICELEKLETLKLQGNGLKTLPEELGNLKGLATLDLSYNELESVPISLGRLSALTTLKLQGNPLDPALESAYEAGLDELRAYLLSLGEPARREQLYEAKLILVGEGGVGKTTMLKALTGGEPRKNEPTTHGVNIDIRSLRLSHPERDGTEIRLNAWDFGGQEVYRVTHQFFFSRRSIYLVVWEPRRGVQQCQVEDWLKLIRLRVGDDARVVIVSTHARTGERIARIDKPVLLRDFGPMIVGFLEVDSLVEDPKTEEKVGIHELREMIGSAAKELEQMGMEFNRDWREARDELLELGRPRIPYGDFSEICERRGLGPIDAKTLALLMHDLGYIVYYGDHERLRDEVILQPEWLTRAIGFVLEDRTTQEMDGILADARLKEVWWEKPVDGETRFDPGLYPFFLRLMERYDVSYRLEEGNASLVAQQVPQVRPDLPWSSDEDPAPGRRRIAMACVMDDEPTGLVPWMIVRTHEFAYEHRGTDGQLHRLHWQKGMFLRNKDHGEAMLELRGREFHVHVEAVWPEFFMNVLRRTIQKLITDNWPGMKGRYYFGVPCRERLDGDPCDGRFDIGALRQFLEEGDETIRCQSCRRRQNIVELLYGFEEEDSRRQLVRIESKLDRGFAEVMKEFEGLESRMANYVMAILQAVASESKSGPRLFTLEPADGNWKRWVAKRYILRLWCEAEGCQHPLRENGKGAYEFEASRDWVKRIAPYASLVAGVLRTLLPVAAPAVNVLFGSGTIDELGIKDHLSLMKQACGSLLKGDLETSEPGVLRGGLLSEPERSGVLALHSFLRETDPNQENLGLRRVATYTGDYVWLCSTHYERIQPKIPEKIE